MKVAFKSLVAAAAFVSVGLAHAATVIVLADGTPYKGHAVSGSENLVYGATALSFFNLIKATPSTVGTANVAVAVDTAGKYASVNVMTPLRAVAVEDSTDQILAAAGTGGIQWTAPASAVTGSGGSVSLGDLEVNLADKVVYATLTGANGAGTTSRVPMWRITTTSGTTTLTPPASGTAINTFTVSGLQLTATAKSLLVTSFGLNPVSTAGLSSVSDFGSLAVTTVLTPSVLTPCAVTFTTKPAAANAPYFDATVTVQNFGSNAATGWQVNWVFADPTLAVAVKNAKLTNQRLRAYTAQPLSSNTAVAAGGATTFAFRGYTTGKAPAIGNLAATLGGQTCTVKAQ